jgi:hypothetical protein
MLTLRTDELCISAVNFVLLQKVNRFKLRLVRGTGSWILNHVGHQMRHYSTM